MEKNHFEQQRCQKLEEEGWIVIREYEKGRPDAIMLKPRDNGGFDVMVREFKGLGTKCSNEQVQEITRLRLLGIDAEFEFEKK
jgi:hypothetical protein